MAEYKVNNFDQEVVRDFTGSFLCVVTKKFTVATALVLNDTIDMITVPKDAQFAFARLVTTGNLDSGSAVRLHVGDTDDDDRIISAASIGHSGNSIERENVATCEYQWTAETVIKVKCGVAPTTGVTGQSIILTLGYTMDKTY